MANDHNAVAHAWAHQTGRTRRGFNMFYEGETIYSYGRHFPIARLVTAANGERVVLFTSRSYSVSTAKHKTIVWRAVSHLTIFDVENPSAPPSNADFDAMVLKARDAVAKAGRARKLADYHLGSARRWLNDANEFSRAFHLGRETVTLESLGVAVADLEARIAEAGRAEAARRASEARINAQANRERLRLWLKGESVRPPHTLRPMVRVCGDMVETTWGATVPLLDALRTYYAAKALSGRAAGLSASHTVENVGHYGNATVDGRGNIRVGCHTIPFRFAKLAACLAGIDSSEEAAA